MKYTSSILGVGLLLFASFSAAQHGGGGSGMSSGQHGSRGQQGQGQAIHNNTQAQQQTKQRLRIHATEQQHQQVKTCTRSADKIRTQTRDINRAAKNGNITPDWARQRNEQIRSEVQTMTLNHERLVAGLSTEQKNATQERVRQMEQSRNQLQVLSEQLGGELIAPELNQERIRERARETEQAAERLKKSQTDLISEWD